MGVNKYLNKRDSTVDITDQRLSTNQSVNDEF